MFSFREGKVFKGAKMHLFDKTTSDFDFKKTASATYTLSETNSLEASENQWLVGR